MYDRYKDRGFVLLGFPCNQASRLLLATCFKSCSYLFSQFGGQEPGDDDSIASFCELNHGVSFPLMKKSDVNGDDTNRVYKWLKDQKSGLLGLTRIKVRVAALSAFLKLRLLQWNFEKFLIDKKGNVVNRWASTTTPSAIDPYVEKLLSE